MSHLATWLWLVVGIVAYRLLTNTATPLDEHIAGIYFSGCALLAHWLAGMAGRE